MTTSTEPGNPSTAVSARPLIELGTSYWAARTLLAAVEVGVFTELGITGPADIDRLRARLDLHPRSARDFLDALVALGLLDRTDGRYRNTELSAYFLDENEPTYLGGWMRQASRHLFGVWGGLTASLRSGKPTTGWDTDVFEQLYADPAERRNFIAAMDAWTTHIAIELASGVDWSGHRDFVDAGGARGNLAARLVTAHPHLTGTVFDRPEIASLFDEHMRLHHTEGRVRLVVGDFFADDLPATDVLIFGHILHDWDDRERRALMARAYRAVRPGGLAIVYDRMIDDDRRTHAIGLLGSLNLLLVTPGGSEYTVADCRSYAHEAGFAETSSLSLFDGLETAVIARKASHPE